MGKAPDLGKCTFEVGGHMGFFGTANISENRIDQSLAKDSNSPIDCIWTITVAENYQVYIKFNEPALAFPNDCHLNYLQVGMILFFLQQYISTGRIAKLYIHIISSL